MGHAASSADYSNDPTRPNMHCSERLRLSHWLLRAIARAIARAAVAPGAAVAEFGVVVRREKQCASCQVKDLVFQKLTTPGSGLRSQGGRPITVGLPDIGGISSYQRSRNSTI